MGTSQPTDITRKGIRHVLAAAAVPALIGVANAQQSDLAAGEELYTAQCKICHGSVTAAKTGDASSITPYRRLVYLAMREEDRSRRTDFLPQAGLVASPAAGLPVAWPGAPMIASRQLAFAPPFGPNLRGIYGRPAGSVAGFQYSKTFMKTLQGMEWNEAALDVWITNPQAWVPGVYMFYKQPDPEIRRKIILYLKANP